MEKGKFLIILKDIAKIAKKDKWVPTYNKQLDYFSWTKPVLSEGFRLVKISHDVFLYFNKKGMLEGLDIEYLTDNFIEHNPSYKEFPKLFTEKIDGNIFSIPKEKQEKIESILPNFVTTIRADIYEDAVENNQGMEKLQNLVNVALKN